MSKIFLGIILASFSFSTNAIDWDSHPYANLRFIDDFVNVGLLHSGGDRLKSIENREIRKLLVSRLKLLLTKTQVTADGKYLSSKTRNQQLDRKKGSVHLRLWFEKQENNLIVYYISFQANSLHDNKKCCTYITEYLGLTSEKQLMNTAKEIIIKSTNAFFDEFKEVNIYYDKSR